MILEVEHITICSIVVEQKDRHKFYAGDEIKVGDKQLFPFLFRDVGDDYVKIECVYYPRGLDLASEYIRANKMVTTSNGENLAIRNTDFLTALTGWLTEPSIVKVNNNRYKGIGYLADYIDKGFRASTVASGIYIRRDDVTQVALINKNITMTLFHEVGAHRTHRSAWGAGDDVLWTEKEIQDIRKDWAYNVEYQINDDVIAYNALNFFDPAKSAAEGDRLRKLLAAVQNDPIILNLNNITNSIYDGKGKAEDEYLARIYAQMALNACVTFGNDIYARFSTLGITMREEVTIEIDRIMKEEMKLNKRTYK